MFRNFGIVFRNVHVCKELIAGLQKTNPAACGVAGGVTCRSTAAFFNTAGISTSSWNNPHNPTICTVSGHLPLVQQKRFVRKLYPDPLEQDPYYYQLPEEEGELDIDHVPVLNNNGPELVERVKQTFTDEDVGRLFCVIHVGGQQRKVTTEDLVLVDGFFPPQIGDQIRLEKVMLVGSKDFTLLGRPVLSRDLVKVEATVIEKTLSHVRVNFTYKKRFRRLKLVQTPQTVLVINSIEVDPSALK